ncbi:hypothetical protein Q3G72_018546 [Acer saccharum]|nr:hypothetical protein Q3G72_018546 [Acer saccharum]
MVIRNRDDPVNRRWMRKRRERDNRVKRRRKRSYAPPFDSLFFISLAPPFCFLVAFFALFFARMETLSETFVFSAQQPPPCEMNVDLSKGFSDCSSAKRARATNDVSGRNDIGINQVKEEAM